MGLGSSFLRAMLRWRPLLILFIWQCFHISVQVPSSLCTPFIFILSVQLVLFMLLQSLGAWENCITKYLVLKSPPVYEGQEFGTVNLLKYLRWQLHGHIGKSSPPHSSIHKLKHCIITGWTGLAVDVAGGLPPAPRVVLRLPSLTLANWSITSVLTVFMLLQRLLLQFHGKVFDSIFSCPIRAPEVTGRWTQRGRCGAF